MKLHGRNRLETLYGLDEDTDKWLSIWKSELSRAAWKHGKDVFRQYPRAVQVADSVFQFRVGLQAHLIEVSMAFALDIAVITDLKQIN
jgi:mRNA-degrading endonuclease HigB of HigAB toxin-antitoxin module